MRAEISPVKAPSLAQYRFCAPIRMRVPCAPPTAAAMSVKGGQITISQCSDLSTRGRNFSKNDVVSAGVLYIFQLPAITGFLINLRQETRAIGNARSEVLRDRLAYVGQSRTYAEVHSVLRTRPTHEQRNVFAAMVRRRGCRVTTVVRCQYGQVVFAFQCEQL